MDDKTNFNQAALLALASTENKRRYSRITKNQNQNRKSSLSSQSIQLPPLSLDRPPPLEYVDEAKKDKDKIYPTQTLNETDVSKSNDDVPFRSTTNQSTEQLSYPFPLSPQSSRSSLYTTTDTDRESETSRGSDFDEEDKSRNIYINHPNSQFIKNEEEAIAIVKGPSISYSYLSDDMNTSTSPCLTSLSSPLTRLPIDEVENNKNMIQSKDFQNKLNFFNSRHYPESKNSDDRLSTTLSPLLSEDEDDIDDIDDNDEDSSLSNLQALGSIDDLDLTAVSNKKSGFMSARYPSLDQSHMGSRYSLSGPGRVEAVRQRLDLLRRRQKEWLSHHSPKDSNNESQSSFISSLSTLSDKERGLLIKKFTRWMKYTSNMKLKRNIDRLHTLKLTSYIGTSIHQKMINWYHQSCFKGMERGYGLDLNSNSKQTIFRMVERSVLDLPYSIKVDIYQESYPIILSMLSNYYYSYGPSSLHCLHAARKCLELSQKLHVEIPLSHHHILEEIQFEKISSHMSKQISKHQRIDLQLLY